MRVKRNDFRGVKINNWIDYFRINLKFVYLCFLFVKKKLEIDFIVIFNNGIKML